MKDDRCEKCEQMAAELRAELRAEFNRRIDEILDHISAAVADVKAINRGVMEDIRAINRGLLADVERRVQRLFETLSERWLLPRRTDEEEPPRPH